MPVLVKVTFSRPLTMDERNESLRELTPYIQSGLTKDYFPESVDHNVSYREWANEEVASEVIQRLVTMPWCANAEMIST
jgi:hypothetical protein